MLDWQRTERGGVGLSARADGLDSGRCVKELFFRTLGDFGKRQAKPKGSGDTGIGKACSCRILL